jgi:hypothetical protein
MATPSLPSCVNRVVLTASAICPVSVNSGNARPLDPSRQLPLTGAPLMVLTVLGMVAEMELGFIKPRQPRRNRC